MLCPSFGQDVRISKKVFVEPANRLYGGNLLFYLQKIKRVVTPREALLAELVWHHLGGAVFLCGSMLSEVFLL